jgi:hypothetical protein
VNCYDENYRSFYTVPAGKTFIVTDVVVSPNGYLDLYALIPSVGSTRRAYLYAPSGVIGFFPFQAGIRFDAGETLHCNGNSTTTFTGYEF